jgi:hypothetical protein
MDSKPAEEALTKQTQIPSWIRTHDPSEGRTGALNDS